MAIDFATFTKVAPHVAAVRKPVLIRGRHGVGKSEVVYQIAGDLEMPVVERRASQMTEGDLVGLPSTDGNVTSFNPPDWFKTSCDNPVVLFLDEVDRATIEVRQGIFELTDSRKLNGHTLDKDTLVFAAVNGGEHGDQYQVGEMDPAELDRWTVFDVEPTVEDWLTWGKDKIDGMVWDFINQNRSHLEHTGDFEPNKVYPSRRSWARLNDCFVQADLLVEDADASLMFPLATGFVGFEAAVSFKDFVDNYERQVTIENILDEGKMHLTDRFGINDHNALVEKMEAKDIFKVTLSEERVENLARYFMKVPSEVGMKLWTVLGQGDNANVIAFHGTIVDGKSISNHLVELMTGKNISEDDEE
jgi:alkaline phosphatase D